MPNEIQMPKCQNIKSVSFVIGILGLISHLGFVICHFLMSIIWISVKITLTKSYGFWNKISRKFGVKTFFALSARCMCFFSSVIKYQK